MSREEQKGITRPRSPGRRRVFVIPPSKAIPPPKRDGVKLHILAAEKALGRKLAGEEMVHHADENPANFENSNLVICPDKAYHNFLHQRLRVYHAGFDPNLYKHCTTCRTHKLKSDFSSHKLRSDGLDLRCKSCMAAYLKTYHTRTYRRKTA